uniref:Uncharacterized protein n=1 Tax=Siphoviridae sp. ctNZc11 TaxID=2827858 RepID=A0A8S5TCL0_9CAUD|nr:MAG TPA: hypothetical protein [Siphoviridae sp. ctNZc11]DAL70135.1 MAG TPA: hypothetical protein [Caudoviricetes sp.]
MQLCYTFFLYFLKNRQLCSRYSTAMYLLNC